VFMCLPRPPSHRLYSPTENSCPDFMLARLGLGCSQSAHLLMQQASYDLRGS
ncbi:hypothetical protein P692DRAFT_20832330, partial [Suillus brevipes Sb2]